MKPTVLVSLVATVLHLSGVSARASTREATMQAAIPAEGDMDQALSNVKAAMDALNKVLEMKELVVAEAESQEVPAQFNNVVEVLGNLKAVDDALWEQESERLERRNEERYQGLDPKDEKARREASLSASAFFRVQEPAIVQLAKQLDLKLQALDADITDSVFTKPTSTLVIAAARLKQELDMANLPYMIEYNKQAHLHAIHSRLKKLATATIKACTTNIAVAALPTGLPDIVELFEKVGEAIDLLDECLEEAVTMTSDENIGDAIAIFLKMVEPYTKQAVESYKKVVEPCQKIATATCNIYKAFAPREDPSVDAAKE